MMEFLEIPWWFWTGSVKDSLCWVWNQVLTTFDVVLCPISTPKLSKKTFKIFKNKQNDDGISGNSRVVLDRISK